MIHVPQRSITSYDTTGTLQMRPTQRDGSKGSVNTQRVCVHTCTGRVDPRTTDVVVRKLQQAAVTQSSGSSERASTQIREWLLLRVSVHTCTGRIDSRKTDVVARKLQQATATQSSGSSERVSTQIRERFPLGTHARSTVLRPPALGNPTQTFKW